MSRSSLGLPTTQGPGSGVSGSLGRRQGGTYRYFIPVFMSTVTLRSSSTTGVYRRGSRLSLGRGSSPTSTLSVVTGTE